MSSSRRSCCNDPDKFCYICGQYTFKKQRKTITDFVRKVYLAYFKVKLGDQDKLWPPHIVCKACVEKLRKWTNGTLASLRFGVPMVWREPKNHFDDCYFCLVNLKGFNRHKKNSWNYPDLESARLPVPHCEEVPVPEFSDLPDISMGYDEFQFHKEVESSASDSVRSVFESSSSVPEQFKQEEVSDLVRDLNLSKEAAEILASRLKDKNCLRTGASITLYRTREKELFPYFSEQDELVYCKDIEGLLLKMRVPQYRAPEWLIHRQFKEKLKMCIAT